MRTLRTVLLLGFLAALFAVVPAGASNTVTYQDSTGEDPAAPDITTVVVSNDDTGMVTFKINIPNRPQLSRDILLDMIVDTDANSATGDPDSLGGDSGRFRSRRAGRPGQGLPVSETSWPW